MTGGVKQHPDVFLGLELSKCCAHLYRPGGTSREVLHCYVEMGLDLLLAGRTRPGGSNIGSFIFEVQRGPGCPRRWSELSPAILGRTPRPGRLRSGDGPLEQTAVEVGQGSRIVGGDRDRSDHHRRLGHAYT